MKLGGSLGNVPQKIKNLKLDIFRAVSPFSKVQFILNCINCTHENGLTV
jgi:hypothetical protein